MCPFGMDDQSVVGRALDGLTTLATAQAELAAAHASYALQLITAALAEAQEAQRLLEQVQEQSPTGRQEAMVARFAETIGKQHELQQRLTEIQRLAQAARRSAVELPGRVRCSGDHLRLVDLGRTG